MDKYKIKTYGCKLNRADSNKIKKEADKFLTRSSEKDADLIIINSCGVIDKTERKIIKEIERLKSDDKKIIVLGCLPYMTKKLTAADMVIEGNDSNELIKALNKMGLERKRESEKRKKKTTEIISISEGCLGSCTYCGAKLARGELKSYPRHEIIRKSEQAIKSGIKEIQLTSQDLGIYGMDRGENQLIDLLTDLISIEGSFKIKLGMMNPGFIKPFTDRLLNLFSSDKLYNFLHLPVQSGSEKILKDMKRGHTVSDFTKIINKVKRSGEFLIATDIIVGYPTETEADFKKSLRLIEETRPQIVNITRYSERRGTEAEKLKDLPSRIKKERSRKLTELTKKIRIEENRKMVGKRESVLVVRKGKGETFLTRTATGKAVIIKNGVPGQVEEVKIVDFKHNYLIGKNVES